MKQPLDHDVGQWIARWAEQQPDAPAWADADRRCDFEGAAQRIEHLAGWLEHAGIEPGDRLAIWLGNRSATLEILFAAARLGAIGIPVNARLTPEEVAFQLDDSRPTLLFIETRWRDRALEATTLASIAKPRLVAVGGGPGPDDAYESALAEGRRPLRDRTPEPDDPMMLMYTSGTTGKPKGALLPLRKTLFNSLNAERYFATSPADRVLVVAPLFHSLGLQILALPALFAGGGLVIQDGFDPERVWRTIDREGITYYGGVPTMHQRLLDALDVGQPFREPPSALRFAFTAGAAAPAELIRAYHERGLAMMQGYGQTETSILTCLAPAQTLTKAGSVGRPVQHAEIRVIDPETIDGEVAGWQDVAEGDVGEIVVRGPITMLGYWERPEATAETLREGWVRTGDLATFDRDFDLTLVGRAREMYISGGENVYPAEIEATLVEHPEIAEAAVVAIADPEWGEVGHAHVVATAGCTPSASDVLDWLGSRLARFKQPRSIVFHAALPRTASGKVQKHLL